MNRLISRVSVLGAAIAAVLSLIAYSPSRVSAAPVIPNGNVMVSQGANGATGLVYEFSPTGTLVQILDTTKGAGIFTTGEAFDASGNFYVTDFDANDVSEFDPTGTTLLGSFGSGYNTDDESILFDAAGNAYVGQADGSHLLLKFTSTGAPGTPLASFAPATEGRGTDWDDLAADQCTMLYTSEGVHVKSFNVCTNSQNADFAGPLPGVTAYGLRILPHAVGSLAKGSVLVADTSEVTVLDNTGAQIRHDLTGVGATILFAVNFDPDGTSYWTGDAITGEVYRVDIATGTKLTNWNAGFGVGGVTVKGGLTAAQIPVCSGAVASTPALWPPNHKFVAETIAGVTDQACGGVTTSTITGISQDQPTLGGGSGHTCPDGTGVGTSTVRVRAERAGTDRNGRLYYLNFAATDCNGNSCNGTVTVCVPHDHRGAGCVPEVPLFDSTTCP